MKLKIFLKNKKLSFIPCNDRFMSQLFHSIILGCPMRQLEMERIKIFLKKSGVSITKSIDLSDIVILSACSFTRLVERNSISEIEIAHNKSKTIIITGCISKTVLEELKNRKIDFIFINPIEFEKFESLIPDKNIKFDEIETPAVFSKNELCEKHYETPEIKLKIHSNIIKKYYRKKALNKEDKIFVAAKQYNLNPAFVAINTGCVLDCSFCNTKKCITDIKSRTIDEINRQYKKLMKAGFRQFIFISEDIGSYGFDIQENLPQLLNTLNKATENNSIRWQLDGLNPIWAVKYETELLPLIRKDRIYAITIPFQFGSKRILKLMNRFSDIERIDKCIKNFRKQYKLLRLHSVFMIGFPSETDEDFKETLRFIVDINPEIDTFTFYSEFDHCKSAKIFPKVPIEVIRKRIESAKKVLMRRNIAVKY